MSNLPPLSKEDAFEKDNNSQNREENIHYKRPDFIIIDDKEDLSARTDRKANNEQRSNDFRPHIQQSPFFLRILCFLGLIFCLIVGLGLLVFSVVLTLLAALLLFQHKKLNRITLSFWKLYTNLVIIGLGCMIGVLNPSWGIGLLILYFALSGERVGKGFFKTILKNSFK